MKLFTYGSLMKRFWNNYLLAADTFIGNAKMSGPYELWWYPGQYPMILDSNEFNTVKGEVYEVSDQTLATLDQMERNSGYERRSMMVAVGKTEERAEVYVFARTKNKWMEKIENGNYRSKRKQIRCK